MSHNVVCECCYSFHLCRLNLCVGFVSHVPFFRIALRAVCFNRHIHMCQMFTYKLHPIATTPSPPQKKNIISSHRVRVYNCLETRADTQPWNVSVECHVVVFFRQKYRCAKLEQFRAGFVTGQGCEIQLECEMRREKTPSPFRPARFDMHMTHKHTNTHTQASLAEIWI